MCQSVRSQGNSNQTDKSTGIYIGMYVYMHVYTKKFQINC